MSPETEKNIDQFVNSWFFTNDLLVAILGLCIVGPIALLLIVLSVAGIVDAFFFGDFGTFVTVCPVTLILALLVILDDGTPLFKKKPKEHSAPILSEAENRKKAESLWKF